MNLTAQQKSDLAAFLETLTGSAIYTDEKYSTPFNTEFVTLRASGVPNVGYLFQKSPDLDKSVSATVIANSAGVLETTVTIDPEEETMFYRFAYGVAMD